MQRKKQNKTLAPPQGSSRDEADVAIDEAAATVGTGGAASTEAREPTQHPWELEPNWLVIP